MRRRNSSVRPDLWERLTSEEAGVVVLDGLRIVFLPASTLTDIQAAGERVLGKGVGSIFFEAGKRTGRDIGVYMRKMMGSAPPESILRSVEAGHRERGYGDVAFVTHNLPAGELLARVKNSPYAQSQGPHHGTACYFPLGFWVGLVEAVSGKTLKGEETQCEAKGRPYCEFTVSPA